MTLLAGRYELGAPLGAGGMARVIAAHDRTLDRPVAIKLIRDELLADPENRARLLREARGAASLQHPNTVAVHDVGEDAGVPFIVMELVLGESLAEVLRRHKRLPLSRTLEIVDGVLAGLAAAHQRGLIHRDVKPSNILLPPDGGAKLADFGIALALAAATTRLTSTGQVLGTPRYLAPEQTAGLPATPASDVYAVGVVAYECLAGHPPFEAETPIALALAHQHGEVPPLARTAPDAPAGLAAVIERALAKDPADRFVDAESMRTAMQTALGDGSSVASLAEATRSLATTVALDDPRSGDTTVALDDPRSGDTTTVMVGSGPPADTGERGRNWLLPGLAAALLVLLAIVVLTRGGDPDAGTPGEEVAEEQPATDAPDEGPDTADEPPEVVPPATDDLDGLIAGLAGDPGAAGEKGGDLLDGLRELQDEGDASDRREDARTLIMEIADWMAAGELEPGVGRDAIRLLEPVGRPPDAPLEAPSALFAEVAASLEAWGEKGGDLLSGLEKLLETSAPGQVTKQAEKLSKEIEDWIGKGELDGDRGSAALEVLRPLAGRD